MGTVQALKSRELLQSSNTLRDITQQRRNTIQTLREDIGRLDAGNGVRVDQEVWAAFTFGQHPDDIPAETTEGQLLQQIQQVTTEQLRQPIVIEQLGTIRYLGALGIFNDSSLVQYIVSANLRTRHLTSRVVLPVNTLMHNQAAKPNRYSLREEPLPIEVFDAVHYGSNPEHAWHPVVGMADLKVHVGTTAINNFAENSTSQRQAETLRSISALQKAISIAA